MSLTSLQTQPIFHAAGNNTISSHSAAKKPLTALSFLAANPAFTDDAKKGRQSK
jgi:hypothetical protein